ncbi:MAG: cupin domain-containing protein [Pseudomonadota bacterium]
MKTFGLPDHLLSEYTSGTLDADFEVLVASHLAISTKSHENFRFHQEIAGALFAGLPAGATQPSSSSSTHLFETFSKALVELETATHSVNAANGLPQILVDYLETLKGVKSLSELNWIACYEGIERVVLTEGANGVRARILKCQPGAIFPNHGHGSEEVSLVLQGAYTDAGAHYVRGDVQCISADEQHSPVIDDNEICFVLVVSELPAIILDKSKVL